MEGTYGVYLGESLCGKVQVQKQGLYYRFFCRCQVKGDMVCKLRIRFQDSEENLGVLTPAADGFGLCTRIAVKHFSQKPLRFLLTPVHGIAEGTFVPIVPEEPFAYIERLKDAYLSKKDGLVGVCLKDKTAVSKF